MHAASATFRVFIIQFVDVFLFFFFSSRRRHTRFDCDWSSDVCSSDLTATTGVPGLPRATRGAVAQACRRSHRTRNARRNRGGHTGRDGTVCRTSGPRSRSEERRVGKEGRSRWAPDHLKKKKKSKEEYS